MSDATVHIAHRQINCNMLLNERYEIPCILDTGAMTCCVNNELMMQLGCKPQGTIGVGGATGHSQAPVYHVKLGIKGLDGFEVLAEVIGLPTQTALLGYNLFRHLDRIDIDFHSNAVTFHSDNNSVTHK